MVISLNQFSSEIYWCQTTYSFAYICRLKFSDEWRHCLVFIFLKAHRPTELIYERRNLKKSHSKFKWEWMLWFNFLIRLCVRTKTPAHVCMGTIQKENCRHDCLNYPHHKESLSHITRDLCIPTTHRWLDWIMLYMPTLFSSSYLKSNPQWRRNGKAKRRRQLVRGKIKEKEFLMK